MRREYQGCWLWILRAVVATKTPSRCLRADDHQQPIVRFARESLDVAEHAKIAIVPHADEAVGAGKFDAVRGAKSGPEEV